MNGCKDSSRWGRPQQRTGLENTRPKRLNNVSTSSHHFYSFSNKKNTFLREREIEKCKTCVANNLAISFRKSTQKVWLPPKPEWQTTEDFLTIQQVSGAKWTKGFPVYDKKTKKLKKNELIFSSDLQSFFQAPITSDLFLCLKVCPRKTGVILTLDYAWQFVFFQTWVC